MTRTPLRDSRQAYGCPPSLPAVGSRRRTGIRLPSNHTAGWLDRSATGALPFRSVRMKRQKMYDPVAA